MMREFIIGCAIAGGALYISHVGADGDQHTVIRPPLQPITPTMVTPYVPPLPDYVYDTTVPGPDDDLTEVPPTNPEYTPQEPTPVDQVPTCTFDPHCGSFVA